MLIIILQSIYKIQTFKNTCSHIFETHYLSGYIYPLENPVPNPVMENSTINKRKRKFCYYQRLSLQLAPIAADSHADIVTLYLKHFNQSHSCPPIKEGYIYSVCKL